VNHNSNGSSSGGSSISSSSVEQKNESGSTQSNASGSHSGNGTESVAPEAFSEADTRDDLPFHSAPEGYWKYNDTTAGVHPNSGIGNRGVFTQVNENGEELENAQELGHVRFGPEHSMGEDDFPEIDGEKRDPEDGEILQFDQSAGFKNRQWATGNRQGDSSIDSSKHGGAGETKASVTERDADGNVTETTYGESLTAPAEDEYFQLAPSDEITSKMSSVSGSTKTHDSGNEPPSEPPGSPNGSVPDAGSSSESHAGGESESHTESSSFASEESSSEPVEVDQEEAREIATGIGNDMNEMGLGAESMSGGAIHSQAAEAAENHDGIEPEHKEAVTHAVVDQYNEEFNTDHETDGSLFELTESSGSSEPSAEPSSGESGSNEVVEVGPESGGPGGHPPDIAASESEPEGDANADQGSVEHQAGNSGPSIADEIEEEVVEQNSEGDEWENISEEYTEPESGENAQAGHSEGSKGSEETEQVEDIPETEISQPEESGPSYEEGMANYSHVNLGQLENGHDEQEVVEKEDEDEEEIEEEGGGSGN